ncbi:Retrovirus-related Pol polyprotein from transposon 412, partial [Aphis craccivora]
QFKIYTDHKPLTWLFNVKDPGSRLLRWRLKLAEYQIEGIYKTGKSNTNADALRSLKDLKLFHDYISDSECQNYRNASVQEVTGDLFTVSEEFHLLHRVSADLKLNRVAYFQLGTRYIINLITKDKFWQKPTLEDMYNSLQNLRLFCQEVEIQNLAMPKIGCGSDQ